VLATRPSCPVSRLQRAAHVARAASAVAPVPFLNRMTFFLEIGNFAPFSEFLHINPFTARPEKI